MIIGIVGKMQSGKDTVGKIIQMLTDNLLDGIPVEGIEDCVLNTPILNPSFKIVKFADKLKDMVCLLIGCTREDLENDAFKDAPLGEEWSIPLQEEFRDVVGYEGLYQISNFGRLKSLYRIDSMQRVVEESIKSLHINSVGYYACTLNKDGKKKTRTIHQLVAEAFLNHIPNGYKCVINHIDNNKLNNKVDNLEIVSSRYNTQYSKNTQGISFRRNKYEVYIRIEGKKTYLGSFNTEEEAKTIRLNKLNEIDLFNPIRYKPAQWTPRLLLQFIGTNIGRTMIHNNIWVNATMANYKPYTIITGTQPDVNSIHLEERLPNWIITDCRFPNEVHAIKDRGGVVIKVQRNEQERFPVLFNEFLKSGYSDFYHFLGEKHPNVYAKVNHASEISLDNYKFDAVIYNNSSLTDTVEQVKSILKKHNLCQKEN